MLGFTLAELAMVLVITAVLAAVAIPRMSVIKDMTPVNARDQVLAALRQAQSTAAVRRRLVCASIAATSITLSVAATNPSSACTAGALPATGGGTNQVASNAQWAISASPASTLYFQPNGQVTSDAAGATPVAFTVTVAISGVNTGPIAVTARTGSIQ